MTIMIDGFINRTGARCLLAAIFLMAPMKANAQTGEYTVKAAFLERITRFVEWPEETAIADTTKSFVLGIIGENPFGPVLGQLYDTQKIKNKVVEIRPVSKKSEIENCHLLFIAHSKEKELADILSETKNKPVLTVGDTGGFAERGVLVNFTVSDNKIKLEINETAVRESGLLINYRLFAVAKIIDPIGNNR